MEGASSAVPGFLAKLWALVDDSTTDDVIGWSRNGQSFSILDEQKFSKELLPKYFKHNNLSSFIRQLNMYGFRKVVTVENGMVAPEKNPMIEFQHMFFKQGEANLLENIKRKVSSGKAEEFKGYSDDVQKALAEVQEIKEQHIGMENKLASLKRNNKALWKELGSLRQKHGQQQQLLSKIFHFLLGLMRGNYIMGVKKKRSLPDGSGSPPSKFSRQCVPIPVENGEAVDVLDPGSPTTQDSNGVMIQDITASLDDDPSLFGVPSSPSTLILSPTLSGDLPSLIDGNSLLSPVHMIPSFGLDLDMTDCPLQITEDSLEPDEIGDLPLDFHSSQASDSEDPSAVIDSILNDSCLSSQSSIFFNRNEMQDFLNCIETNLEELHSMLSGKKLNQDSDFLIETPPLDFPILNMNEAGTSSNMADTLLSIKSVEEGGMPCEFEADENKDLKLVQYMGNPLLSLFEELPSFEDRPQDASDFFLPDLDDEEEEAIPTYLEDSDDPLCLVAHNLSDHYGSPLEPFQSPLLSEDPNGEYKLFPLLLLSPVANFIEEATEIENTT
ncbi:heat shock factor protein 3-like isoform X1 [Dromiciops gliroides]|uniref:heat shock factor protein 3-like isoform X1 n=1 Tax=Dromiciops gliroides TaxID=33562 RepID=UPI001CC6E989|nr:heat shock factor protein 3-like isoform X1 [Dromiciops gliroides]